ncbi:MAG: molybdate ABC transporter substrate-binding protein [Pyrinomonadaceae bacterium]
MRLRNVQVVAAAGIIAALIIFSGCAAEGMGERPGESEEITVAASSNLSEVFGELAKDFTARTGVRVVGSFGATAELAKQIENGAPFDVFMAADARHVEGLESKGLLTPGTRALYATGRLVLWVPEGGRVPLGRIEELTRPEVTKIAVAKPDLAPYGQAAVEALQALKLWAELEPRVVYAQNVSQAKQFAATGNADAAFIPRALVKENEGVTIEVDERLHRPINQALGVVRASDRQDAARRFVEFVLGAEGQAVLGRYGYGGAYPDGERER